MTQPGANQQPYLPTTRQFPKDIDDLQVTLSKGWIEQANAINARTIGTFSKLQVVTGNQYFNPNNIQQPRQSYRQIYTFDTIAAGATLMIPHGITGLTQIPLISGDIVTAVPDFRPLPYVSATVVTNQVEVRVSSTTITIINGATAPNITAGTVVLEYLLN